MGQLILVQGPQQSVVTLEEAKDQLHVDTVTSDNAKLNMLVLAATQRCDGPNGILGRALMMQTWEMQLTAWPAGAIELPLPPLIAVTAINYLDENGNVLTLDPALYRVVPGGNNQPTRIVRSIGQQWPTPATGQPDAIRVRFDAGYVDASSPSNNAVPEPIRQAIVLMADEWYNRGSMNDIPEVCHSLLSPYKVKRLGDLQYVTEEENAPTIGGMIDSLEAFFRG